MTLNRALTADDDHRLLEFTLDPDGVIGPITSFFTAVDVWMDIPLRANELDTLLTTSGCIAQTVARGEEASAFTHAPSTLVFMCRGSTDTKVLMAGRDTDNFDKVRIRLLP